MLTQTNKSIFYVYKICRNMYLVTQYYKHFCKNIEMTKSYKTTNRKCSTHMYDIACY